MQRITACHITENVCLQCLSAKDIDGGDFRFPEKKSLDIRLKDILEDEIDQKYYLSDKILQGFKAHNERHAEKGTGFMFKPRDTDGIASTIRANSSMYREG